jgi:hypothetical protein
MSDSDYLATIIDVEQAWTDAHGLLCNRVHSFLRKRRRKAKSPQKTKAKQQRRTKPKVPDPLDVAIGKLRVGVHRLRGFVDVPESFPWLVVGAVPITSAAEADYRLQCCADAADKAGHALDAASLLEMPDVNGKHFDPAERIKSWLASEKAKALAGTLSPRQWNALQAVADLKASGSECRVPAAEIAKKAENGRADAFKRPLADLVEKRLLASTGKHGGPGGGYWLTAEGRAVLPHRPAD